MVPSLQVDSGVELAQANFSQLGKEIYAGVGFFLEECAFYTTIQIPNSIQTVEDLMLYRSKQRDSIEGLIGQVLAHGRKIYSDAIALGVSDDFFATTIAEELSANIFYHGLLAVGSIVQQELTEAPSTSTYQRAKKLVEQRLSDPNLVSQYASIGVALDERTIKIEFSDPTGFPSFNEVWEKAGSTESMEVGSLEQEHGRGYIWLRSLLPNEPVRIAATGAIVLSRNLSVA